MSSAPMENINRLWSSLIIDELIKNNITHFYFSPGMRNAPLVAALCFFQKKNSKIKIFTCIDERGASYRALGYTKATGLPSVLLCTSGTALANYLPAIIEASKSQLPLIVLSADRAKEQVLSGDNQAISQNHIYGDFINGELDLGAPSLEISPRDLVSNISNIISKANGLNCGPIHINCPFREPLENIPTHIPESYLKSATALLESTVSAVRYFKTITSLARNQEQQLQELILKSKKGILIIGSIQSSYDLNPIKTFAKTLGWPVYFDVGSSLKYEFGILNNAIPTFDHPEVLNEITSNPPDLIIHIGGRLTSKHYYSFLQSLRVTELIVISGQSDKEDPAHRVQIKITADISTVLNGLISTLNSKTSYSFNFKTFVDNKRKLIEEGPLSYPLISKTIIETLPTNSLLYIANSTIVRSFDSYCSYEINKNFTIATNRGVSGIEGFIASASGFSDGLNQDVFLVIGDVSFMHDLNSLYFLKSLSNKLKIILINNYGGGIFTLLPINKEEEVLSLITSPHTENFECIAKNFNIHYIKAIDSSQLLPALTELQKSKEHTILEVFVDNDLNKSVYDQLKTIKLS